MLEWMIDSASTFSQDVDFLIQLIGVLGAFWLLVSEGIFFWLIFKFRRKNSPKAQYITGEKKEEMKWIHLPHNLVLLCDLAVIVFAVKVWYTVKQDLPPAEETVRVIGQQWAWEFVHPGKDKKLGTKDDVRTIDELHIKKGVVYHFKLESLDVMHDFSVPVFRLKQDAIPGREITGWFEATKTGTYDIQCAEMCGIGHGIMKARIVIETPEEHNKWLDGQGPLAH